MYSSIWIKESCARHTSFIQIIRQRFALIFGKSCHLLPKKRFKHHFNPLKIMSGDSIYFLYQEYASYSKFLKMHLLPLSRFGQQMGSEIVGVNQNTLTVGDREYDLTRL